jgi:hypothetical protein
MNTKPALFIKGSLVHNVFQLLGDDEDSISLAITWALANAPSFLATFLERGCRFAKPHGDAQIWVHRHEGQGGITDVEIVVHGALHVIVEAKRGWMLPAAGQLRLYGRRESFAISKGVRRIVTLSECSQAYARAHLPLKAIGAVPVTHVSWAEIIGFAREAEASSGHVEKRLLRELANYLRSVMSTQNKSSNLVFVVSLASRTEEGWTTSWLEIVTKYSRYFHPVGDGWPKDPPNYVGFRYAGRLQSIHHVEEYEVIDNLKNVCPGIPDIPVAPHYLYKLGPAMIPPHEVRNGNIYPSGRVWCAIDTLLTSSTVSGARGQTQARGIAAEQAVAADGASRRR